MKRYFTIIIGLSLAVLSCEKDDICIEETTPKLIILFRDFEDKDASKQVDSLIVWAVEKDSIYLNQTLDSIALPLDLNANTTFYNFQATTIIDALIFGYDRNDIFVGRSCGYKTIFENLQIESNSSNWIKEIEIMNTSIENDTAAHITIFH